MTEEGTAGGIPITGATVAFVDQYSNEITATTDSEGKATFYKQFLLDGPGIMKVKASDGHHENGNQKTVELSSYDNDEFTVELASPTLKTKNVTVGLETSFYHLPVPSATLAFAPVGYKGSQTVSISAGFGSGKVYAYNANVTVETGCGGIDKDSIYPTTFDFSQNESAQFEVAEAEVPVTVHVTEDGTAGGTPVVGATVTFVSSGGVTVGPQWTDSDGEAIFERQLLLQGSSPGTIQVSGEHGHVGGNATITYDMYVANPDGFEVEIASPYGSN